MKSVVITGAAKGIGRACVDAFLSAGWGVVAVDLEVDALRSEERLRALAGDVRDPHLHARAVAAALDEFGTLEAAVANAGVNLRKTIDESTRDDYEHVFGVNVEGVIGLAKAAHEALGRTRGSLVVMASKTGLVAQPSSPLYCASKGAAVMLARALAIDWADEGIRVNAVCPGIVDTPMLRMLAASQQDPDAWLEEQGRAQPLGRLATAEECAAAAFFLASDAAAFITGVALPVDGGFTAQ